MNLTEARDFHAFADTVGLDLLPVAYALTGNQPAAERLVTGALARVARRWHRFDDDPAQYTTRVLYRTYAAGRSGGDPLEVHALDQRAEATERMRHVALRQLTPRQRAFLVLRFLQERTDAEAAEVIDGAAEVAGGEIAAAVRRFQDLYAGVAGQAAGEVDAEAALRQTLRELADAAEPAALGSAALASLRRQRRTRAGVAVAATVVALAAVNAVAERGLRRVIELPAHPGVIAWSPDGRRIAASLIEFPELPPEGDPDYEEALELPVRPTQPISIIDVETSEVSEVVLDLPAGLAGLGGAFWIDTERIAVSIFDTSRTVPSQDPGTGGSQDIPRVSIGIFDLAGTQLGELPTIPDDADADELHAGLIWEPAGLVRGDQVLLIRQPERDVLELAAADLGGASAPDEAVAITMRAATIGDWPGWPIAWLADGRVLVAPTRRVEERVTTVSLVDLDTGAVRAVNPAAELPPELPVPPTATDLTFADADALPPVAAHLAFLP